MNYVIHMIAYIDPGSGLLIWQAIAAGALGVVFYFKRFRDLIWAKIALLFRSRNDETRDKQGKES